MAIIARITKKLRGAINDTGQLSNFRDTSLVCKDADLFCDIIQGSQDLGNEGVQKEEEGSPVTGSVKEEDAVSNNCSADADFPISRVDMDVKYWMTTPEVDFPI
ncbi:hypothetical protein C5167_001705 [Papaver somniferum]|uniref:Uncharacterized protein n=1 Tax=Papaver somniferum TaxID=3469 RepID=A0A4Y7KV78_PAPSO|nr:hypothetical protein C5167_001705 [Papaver somniferum]